MAEPIIELIKAKVDDKHRVQVVLKVAEFEHEVESVVDEAADQLVSTMHRINGKWHKLWEDS